MPYALFRFLTAYHDEDMNMIQLILTDGPNIEGLTGQHLMSNV